MLLLNFCRSHWLQWSTVGDGYEGFRPGQNRAKFCDMIVRGVEQILSRHHAGPGDKPVRRTRAAAGRIPSRSSDVGRRRRISTIWPIFTRSDRPKEDVHMRLGATAEKQAAVAGVVNSISFTLRSSFFALFPLGRITGHFFFFGSPLSRQSTIISNSLKDSFIHRCLSAAASLLPS